MGKTENLVKLDFKDPNLWHSQDAPLDLKLLPNYYLMLSKSRLTMLVCITSAAGYGLAASGPFAFDPVILGISTLGVGLTSAAANATKGSSGPSAQLRQAQATPDCSVDIHVHVCASKTTTVHVPH